MKKQSLSLSIALLHKINMIVDLYPEDDLDIIVEHIYQDLKALKKSKSPTSSQPMSDELTSVVENLKSLDLPTLKQTLNTFSRANLFQINKSLQLKVNSKSTKATLITELVNYFTFINLHKKIESRPTNSL